MLPPSLYEQVINTALNRELSEISDARKSVAPSDKEEASKVLAQYLADVVQKGLENVSDNGGNISTRSAKTPNAPGSTPRPMSLYRNIGFTTAYVDSSNLSNATISRGLEWNVKVTRRDLPETIDKFAATFESYWNSTVSIPATNCWWQWIS